MRRVLTLALVTGLAGCSSSADDVCQEVDDCSQGGSYTWVQSCQTEAQELGDQAKASGCSPDFDAYYACADSAYQCSGITAAFPGCDAQRATLQTCLVASPAESACTALSEKEAACPGSDDSIPPGPIAIPCTLGQQCQAHCYLDQVADPCGPSVDDLAALTQCSQACPP